MATWYLGPLRIGQGLARKAGVAGGVAAVAGGLALGVATAADPGAVQAAPGGTATPAGQTIPVAPANVKPVPAPRLPLHQLIAARLAGRRPAAQAVRPAQRLVVGRLTSFAGGGGTVQTAAGKLVTVHTNAQTRLPVRRARAGDQVVVVGMPEPDGSFLARAVLSRPAPLRAQPPGPIARALRNRLANNGGQGAPQ